ncbi:MAG: beta-ketoacyl-[acyl-carrier-protein] synthase family protein [Bacteroidota bacterium]
MNKRVVVTGVGVVAPNGVGRKNFLNAIKAGKSGIKFIPKLKELNFGCQIGGIPDISNSSYNNLIDNYGISPYSITIKYACIAGLEAWEDAGFAIPDYDSAEINHECGIIIGSSVGNVELWGEMVVPLVNRGILKRLGGRTMEQVMFSSPGAHLSGILALGNMAVANSNACATGTDSILLGYERIKDGKARIMMVGGTEGCSPYAWAPLDSARITTRKYNDRPGSGSRPMSASASGFVPGAGAGILVIEDMESALNRNAEIYAEISGGHINCGGQRQGGSMSAPNSNGVRKCIEEAIKDAKIKPEEIDCISGHLTSTMADSLEIKNWADALNRKKSGFPYVNSLKSMTGHCLGASGAIETIASLMEIYHNFIHPSLNCEDLDSEIAEMVDENLIPGKTISNINVNCIAKASFGFGDVNSCLILKKFDE